ncbi:toll/interleukin-1 receptor domain-containing protein [Acinetobacter oleivorans]|uniref:toll/interleukin-1 receptor domain-containing protein n=1 Tax=Acinetobacter oleivorans TaxID=1148157 RepID=UPI00178C9788|nr:toll/interleukin-1 receptor domain-containing protein [Acinetobacter oleivorans]MBE2170694.1 toll/interleukin-1 receptor domain-containing protein [Acinetobacter oleivorans]MDY7371733.1 toll/interleukin-1 receptor domain-containing protein [Acinetobacter oleivorans]
MEKGKSKIDMLGYDFFISFTLGPYPRGTQSYASDLARKLREKNFTVFYSEEEAPPGANLSNVLLKALRKSKVLLVIVNEGALLKSTWVKKEVEYFHSKNPKRLIVPINIGNTLEKYGDIIEADNWLNYKNNIWIVEDELAVETGIASKTVVDRITVSYHFLKKKNKLIILLTIFITILILLSVFLWVNMKEAKTQKTTSLLTLYSLLQQNGDFKSVFENLSVDGEIPKTTILNSKLALNEINKNSLKKENGKIVMSDLYIGGLNFVSLNAKYFLLSQGHYSGIGLKKIGKYGVYELCNDSSQGGKIYYKDNINYFVWVSDYGVVYKIKNYNNCEEIYNEINSNESSSVVTVELINNNSFVMSDNGGNVYYVELKNDAKKIFSTPDGDKVILIQASKMKDKFLLLTKKRWIYLINDKKNILEKIKIKNDKILLINNFEISKFIKEIVGDEGFSKLIDTSDLLENEMKEKYIYSEIVRNNHVYLSLLKTEDSVDYTDSDNSTNIEFSDFANIPIVSRLDFKGNKNCPIITWVTNMKLVSVSLIPDCDDIYGRFEVKIPSIPIDYNDLGTLGTSYSSAVFNKEGNSLIMGTQSGVLVWMRYNSDGLLLVEHFEHSVNDPVNSIVLGEKNTVYAGFEHLGINTYKEKFKLENKYPAEKRKLLKISAYESLKEWDVNNFYGKTKLVYSPETGYLSLNKKRKVIWNKILTTENIVNWGFPVSNRVVTLKVDESSGRVWVLLSSGQLFLLDINNGSQIRCFLTDFNALEHTTSILMSEFIFDKNGGVSFTYKTNHDPDKEIKILIDN